MRIEHSKIWVQCMGGIVWLAGAGATVMWMMHGGGLIRPAAVFAIAVAALGLALMSRGAAVGVKTMLKALEYGAASGLILLVGTLFVEFWPVTVSMACMFAVCRGFKGDDEMAYS